MPLGPLLNYQIMQHLSNKLYLTTLLILGAVTGLLSQDTYHTNLQTQLASDYQLPNGSYVISNTEQGVLDAAYNWGSSRFTTDAVGQPFTQQTNLVINQPGSNPWDGGFFVQNSNTINQGDRLLWVFYLRSTGGSTGVANVVVEETVSGNYDKEVFTGIDVPEEWTLYFVSFQALLGTHDPNGVQIGFHLAGQAQTIEVGGFTVLNYGTSVGLDDLPNSFDPSNYGGAAENAPWRAPAAERIETLRKANLSIVAQTTSGAPVADAAIQVEMQKHDFAFGTAIKACRLGNNNCANTTFQNRLTNLDGNGHGFNWVVFENDLKWPAWEDEWLATNAEVVNAVSWLRARDIELRGHTLVWPGWQNLPSDMQANATNEPYLLERVNTHVETILNYPGLDNQIVDWDVLNETVSNTSLATALAGEPGYPTGREVYAEIFELAQANAPEAKLYHNDFATLTLNNPPGSGPFNTLKSHIQEIIDAGAPIDGIGLQAHIGGSPNGIPRVLATYDDLYNTFGLDAKITEFDLPSTIDEELAAQYLDDFLTATFSHPSMTGFLFWSFWDVDTYMNQGANLFGTNWQVTPAGEMFINKLFTEWWTSTAVATDGNGNASVRGFKGLYEITYTCNGEVLTEMVDLSEDRSITITCDDFILGLDDNQFQDNFTLSPNPSSGSLTIAHPYGTQTQGRLVNSLGQLVWEGALNDPFNTLTFDLPGGTYVLQLTNNGKWATQRVILQ